MPLKSRSHDGGEESRLRAAKFRRIFGIADGELRLILIHSG